MKIVSIMLNRRVLFDGGMGTQLAARGIEAVCPAMCLESDFDGVAAIHADYVAAGATVVSSDTFGANSIKLGKHGLSARAKELNELGIKAARNGADGKALIALDIGPTGEILSPFGTLALADAYAAFREQADAGKSAGADLAIIETMTSLAEAKAAALAARDAGLDFILSFTYEQNGRTLMGDTPACCAIAAKELGAMMIAANCSGGPEQMLPIIKAYTSATDLPILCQPNAGLPQIKDGVTTFPYSPEAMLDPMRALIDAGVDAIGGCCGTTPAHIAAFNTLTFGPHAHEAKPRAICSGREAVNVDELDMDTLPAMPLDEAEDFDEDAPALIVDCAELDRNDALEALEAAAISVHVPLIFRGGNEDVLTALVRAYAGVPGVAGADIPCSVRL